MANNVSLTGIEFTIKGTSDAATDSINKLINALGRLNSTLSSLSGIKEFSKNMNSLKRAMDGLSKIDTKSFTKGSGSSIGNIADKVKQSSAAFSKLKGAALGAGKAVAKGVAYPFKHAASNAAGLAKRLKGVVGGFKRIIGYRIIRSIIREVTQGFQEGVKNLYEWSRLTGGAMGSRNKTFAQSLDSISTSMLYFKNSIGAAVAPIINALAPAIDFLVSKIVTLLNVLNQLFAKLTGATSWTRAKMKATEYGEAVSGAGEAAQEALRYLAPFDELNVLPDQKDNGSGGGGGGTDYSDMFEDVTEFNEAISNFADMIKEKVNAGDWQGLGELLGNKVNDIVDMIDFAGMGAKVGTGINAWFTTKYWTLETINFQNIGSKIAEFLNNALEQINFDTIGRTITQKFTILGDLIIGAVENINWSLVGNSIGDTVRGAFDQASEWLQGIDWGDFGDSLYNALVDGIQGIDFASVADSLFTLLGSALGAGVSALSSIVKNIISDIKDYFVQFIWDENQDGHFGAQEILDGIMGGLSNAILGIGGWIKDHIVTPFINGFKTAFGISSSPATEMEEPGRMVGEGILQGILKPFKDIGTWITNNILNPIKNFLNSDGNNTEISVEAAVDLVKNGWTSVTSWVKDKMGGVEVSGPVGLIKNGWNSVTSWVKEKMGEVKVESPIDLLKNGWTSVTSWVKTKIGGVTVNSPVDLAKNGWNSVTSWTNEKIGVVKVNSPVDLIKNGWNSVTSWVSDKIGVVTVNSPVGLSKNGWASVSSWVKNELGDTDVSQDVNADLVNPSWKYGKPTMDIDANVENIHVQGGTIMAAQGGVYQGGLWHDIARFDGGGLARGSQLFWARETGSPELVGTLGGHTAVMNNDQIVSSVAVGVRNAIAGIHFKMTGLGSPVSQDVGLDEESIYRAMLRALNESDAFPDQIDLDGAVVYRKMVQRNKLERARTGVNPMMAS